MLCMAAAGVAAYYVRSRMGSDGQTNPAPVFEPRTVTMSGFMRHELNGDYMESEKYAHGKETYWTTSGDYFLYWCARLDKFYIAGEEDFQNNQHGGCTGYARAPTSGHDLTHFSLTTDWVEKGASQWISRPVAGVANVGKFSVPDVGNSPTTGSKSTTEGRESEFAASSGADNWMPSTEAETTALPQQATKCPAKQVVRTVQQKAGELGKVAAGWAIQHFPQLLSGPLGGIVPSRFAQLPVGN